MPKSGITRMDNAQGVSVMACGWGLDLRLAELRVGWRREGWSGEQVVRSLNNNVRKDCRH